MFGDLAISLTRSRIWGAVHFSLDFMGGYCPKFKTEFSQMTSETWVDVGASGALNLWIVKAGIAIDAHLMDTAITTREVAGLLSIKPRAFGTDRRVTLSVKPLHIRMYLFYQLFLCIGKSALALRIYYVRTLRYCFCRLAKNLLLALLH